MNLEGVTPNKIIQAYPKTRHTFGIVKSIEMESQMMVAEAGDLEEWGDVW